MWCGGGGGGYTMISIRTREGAQPIIIAGGGGGGSSNHGLSGGGLDGPLFGERIDIRNGRCGRSDSGGQGGDATNVFYSSFCPTDGEQWIGGDAGEFGGGGGGGHFGGGGGGTGAGIAGGGGGGSCFILKERCLDYLIIPVIVVIAIYIKIVVKFLLSIFSG